MEFFKIELNDNRKHDEELLTIFREELIPNLNIEKLLLLAGSDKSRYTIFCCKIGSKIVSVNIFFILNFIYKKKDYFGYQSGFSATLREFKGKNIWSKLIEFSESEIRKTDNSFIFGYPNENSFPLFVEKLNYKTFHLYNYLLIPGKNYFKFNSLNDIKIEDEYLQVNSADLFEWKKELFKSEKIKILNNNFGEAFYLSISKIKFLFKLNFITILNIRSEKKSDFECLLNIILKSNRKLISIQLPGNFTLTRFFKVKYNKSIPVIYKNLNCDLQDDIQFLIFSLSRDNVNI